MKSISKVLIISAVSLITLAGCSSNNASKDSSSNSHTSSTKKVASSTSNNSQSSSTNANSSSSSSSSSSKTQSVKVNNETAGVLAWQLVNAKYYDENSKGMLYGTNSKSNDAKGYDFITANGDVTSILYYKVNGNQLTYRTWVQTGQATMDGHYKTVTVGLSSLVDQFYSNSTQQSKIQNYVKKLQPYNNK